MLNIAHASNASAAIRPVRILKEVLHVGVSRGVVEIEVVLFNVFAVIPFTVG